MPFNGTGSFSLVSGNPVVTGTNISSTVQNNTMSDFANGFTNCITRDGQSAPTANLPMGNRRHTGAGSASGTGEYLVYGQSSASLASLALTTSLTTVDLTTTGNTTLGNASGDTLTVASNAVTWSGTPVAHTGQHGFAGGVTLGNSAVVDGTVLDYYSEDVFTPAVTASGGTPTYTSAGYYTRIGNRVFVDIYVSVTGWGGATTGAVSITGLPFTAATITGQHNIPGFYVGSSSALNFNGVVSGTTLSVKRLTGANFTANDGTVTWSASFSGSYKV